ncbi:MAG: recombinase family protein [Anaerolineae bacterium]|nr:recombinase family protein [Anaerolineae bacterium]
MSRRNPKPLPPKPGWAIYLRTSNQEAQNPENSQRRQRHAIQRALLEHSELPLIAEYADTMSGRTPDRDGYQRLLDDGRAGMFSHVAVENAERFGRNDTEALTVIDELHRLGVSIRFADYPDLDPIDPDDRIMVSLSFTLARRESIKLGQRVTGGLHTKLRSGGFVGLAPDGYVNMEQRVDQPSKSNNGRYTRWIEPDSEQFKVWRLAWDLLLTDQYTLEQICEELHARGYKYRSGRPFITIKNGRRVPAINTLSKRFRNWFYAGWVVSPKACIAPKTIRGNWKPVVTTEELERGIEILAKRGEKTTRRRKHEYLLSSLIFMDDPENQKSVRMTCSTSNPSRSGGGTAHYRIARTDVNLLCSDVDSQVADYLMRIQVDPEVVPLIRECYTHEVAEKLGHHRPSDQARIEAALKAVDDEEARAARLFATGKITEAVWDNLWAEWQDRRRTLRQSLEAAEQQTEYHIAHLDDALHIITKIGVLFRKLDVSSQKALLREIVERVVVDPSGKVIRVELLPPFSYINQLSDRVGGRGSGNGNRQTKTSAQVGAGSTKLSVGGPDETQSEHLITLKPSLKFLQAIVFPQSTTLQRILNI